MILYRDKLTGKEEGDQGLFFGVIPSPGHPHKRNLLILHFSVDVKRLVEEGKNFPWPRPKRCPRCKSQRLWGHGYVLRYFEYWPHPVWLKRFRCPECRAVHTLRPERFWKGFHYSVLTILLSLLNKILENRWLRCLSRQVQQYWFKGLRFQASRHRNRPDIDIQVLRQLLNQNITPVSHSFQCEILRL